MKPTRSELLVGIPLVLGVVSAIAIFYGNTSHQAAKPASNTASAVDTALKGKKLIFSDEFNGSTLNTSKWGTCYDWRLPSETGCTNDGNSEQEWYTPDQIQVLDGLLSITAIKQSIDVISQNKTKTFPYQSAMINTGRGGTDGHIRWAGTYGYYEARMKFGKGQGVWPAFWLLPTDKSWPPEIDIAEFIGGKPNEILQTVHWLEHSGPAQSSQTITSQDYSGGWHTYGVDWEPHRIDWYIDGVKTRSFSGPNVPNKPMEIILNLAMGGILPKNPDDSTPLPQELQVDYVHVYQAQHR